MGEDAATGNLAGLIEQHPGERTALVDDRRTTSYGELREHVAQLRGGLTALGITPGHRVAIVAANDRHFVASYLAALGVGAVAVPLNPTSPRLELERELAVTGARALLYGPGAESPLEDLDRAALPSLAEVVNAADLSGDPASGIVPRRPADLAVLLFTSGTAGSPRPAMLTHGNLRANIEQILASPGTPRGPGEVLLGALPLFHVFGLNAVLGVGLRLGATIVLLERFEPGATLRAIEAHGVTVASGVPAMWAALAQAPDARPDTLSQVHIALSGAAPLDEDVRRLVDERLGVPLRQGYGLTEASPVVTSGVATDAPAGSIGVPLPGVEVRLVDAGGRDVLVGDPGEIWVRGPNVFVGYWDDAATTRAVLDEDGWLRTGDVAVVDDAGWLYLVDRAKDVIIVSGFNVFPAEVEELIAEHPAVAAAAVVGVPDPRTGEAVRAFVVPEATRTDGERPGVDEGAVLRWCTERLARYKCPAIVTVVDELPSGPTGKILRRALR